ncbi:MAG: ATP-grasp domain-containing protein [Actinomycetota bacterium]|nr:ATP-grasp domain-containing protein [Actinomycetota bacterium]MDQ2958259.1 ATP-grasp domain-containing protein [Actinomycetota bacterium]
MSNQSTDRLPVVVLDRIGYDFYRDTDGRRFLPAEQFEVRLVTGMDKLAEAAGPELDAVVAVVRTDHEAFLDGARLLYRAGGRPAVRIAAITERYLLPVAALREELGLPGMTVDQTLRFRDKVRMKQHLQGKGIRLPDFAEYSSAAARELLGKYSAIVAKPRLGAGAAEVSILRSADDIEQFEQLRAGRLAEFDVEEFIEGTMYHVDSVADRGRVIAATAGASIDENTSFGKGKFYRDVGVPAGPLLDELLAFNAAVIAAHPDFVGVTHHEMFATADGVCFCEIAARAGGGGVLAGFRSRTGCNLDEIVLKAHLLDEVPQQIPVADHLTGFVLIYAGPGRVVALPPPPAEDWVIEVQLVVEPGTLLGPPVDWGDAVAVVTVRGDTEAEVRQRLDVLVERFAEQLVLA